MDRRLLPARRYKVHSGDTFKVFVVLTFRHLFDEYVCLYVREAICLPRRSIANVVNS